jgi:outer membrane biosynthesis protein TonB
LISLGFHLCLVLLLFLMKGPRVEEVTPRRVVIEFSPRREPKLLAATPRQTTLPELLPQQLAESLQMQGPRTLALPGTRAVTDSSQLEMSRGGERFSYAAEDVPLLPQPSAPKTAPLMPAEVLAGQLESPEARTMQENGGSAGDGGYSEAGALEWRDRERKLLKTAGISFPEILLEEGLEVDVVAVFSVAANGQVVEVDIVRSSGYATVDAAVQRSLYGYLFEPSGDSSEDVGQIQVRFRLERGD